MSKSAVNFFLKLVILIFLILPSYANNYSYEEFKSETFNKELSMYDLVKGTEMIIAMGWYSDDECIKIMKEGAEWFKEHNLEAYKILLD